MRTETRFSLCLSLCVSLSRACACIHPNRRRFYGLSAKLSEAFTNDGKDLVLQLSIKNEQKLDCGGAYIKLMGDTDQDSFGGDAPYQVC